MLARTGTVPERANRVNSVLPIRPSLALLTVMSLASPVRLRAGLPVAALSGSACLTGPEPASAACTPDRELLRSGRTAYRQSLLLHAADAGRFSSCYELTQDVRVGCLRDTTGEALLLQVTGLASGDPVVAIGTRIDTPGATVVADGTAAYAPTAAKPSASLEGSTSIHPPDDSIPEVVHLGDIRGEVELVEALSDEAITRVAMEVREPRLGACIASKIEWPTLDCRTRPSGPLTATDAPPRDSAEGSLRREVSEPILGSYVSHFEEQSKTW